MSNDVSYTKTPILGYKVIDDEMYRVPADQYTWKTEVLGSWSIQSDEDPTHAVIRYPVELALTFGDEKVKHLVLDDGNWICGINRSKGEMMVTNWCPEGSRIDKCIYPKFGDTVSICVSTGEPPFLESDTN